MNHFRKLLITFQSLIVKNVHALNVKLFQTILILYIIITDTEALKTCIFFRGVLKKKISCYKHC